MSQLDLNLLTVFDALVEQRSVTKAAQQLNLTQSAISHALRRLRETIGDPLFVRAGGELQLTVRARGMAPGVRDALVRLRQAMMPLEFDPSTAHRAFTIAAGSYFCTMLVPKLIARVRAIAPGVVLRIVPAEAGLLAALNEGMVDIAIGGFERVPEDLVVENLFREELVWISSTPATLEEVRLRPEVVVRMRHMHVHPRHVFEASFGALQDSLIDSIPLEQASTLDDFRGGGPIEAIVHDGMTAAAIVAETDLVALIPRQLAERERQRLGLHVIEPVPSPQIVDARMLIHSRMAGDVGLQWLRRIIVHAAGAGRSVTEYEG